MATSTCWRFSARRRAFSTSIIRSALDAPAAAPLRRGHGPRRRTGASPCGQAGRSRADAARTLPELMSARSPSVPSSLPAARSTRRCPTTASSITSTPTNRSAMPAYDIERLKRRIAGIRFEDNPALVRQKSRDFYWYSPVLKRQLDQVTGDIVVAPKNEAEVVAGAGGRLRARHPADAARRRHRQLRSGHAALGRRGARPRRT